MISRPVISIILNLFVFIINVFFSYIVKSKQGKKRLLICLEGVSLRFALS